MSEVMEQSTALTVPIEQLTAVQVFRPGGVDDVIARIKREVATADPKSIDPSTAAGRKARASLAYKVARSKTALDDMGKSLNDGRRAEINAVDLERRRIRAELDAIAEDLRKPLVEFEQREANRIAAHEAALAAIPEAPGYGTRETAAALRERLNYLREYPAWDWEEFGRRAGEALAAETARTEQLLADAERREAEAAELAQLRAQNAERGRVAGHRQALLGFQRLTLFETNEGSGPDFAVTSADCANRIRQLQKPSGRDWQEFGEQAEAARLLAISQLEIMQTAIAVAEDAARRRREDEIAAEAAQRAREQAEARAAREREAAQLAAQEEREAAARREREAEGALQAAELARQNAERRAQEQAAAADTRAKHELQRAAEREQQAIVAERERVRLEKETERRASEKRAADRAHRGAINRTAMDALIEAGIPAEHAITAIETIARGKVPAVSIQY